MNLHPLQRRWYAEDLVRLRRSDERRRYAAPQRSGRIDANPHQIEAVIFALSRIGEGGCILADEVGLGKTIEAGLVIAQLLAEGAKRIVLVMPKPLLGQWKDELFKYFNIEARDGRAEPGAFDGDGVFLVGREAAGSERGQAALLAAPPFDLIVIDEAHEVFAGLHKRYDAAGNLKDDASAAQTASRLFDVIHATGKPVLLLTATPIQNNLLELWALVRYIDRDGTLLGDLPTFRKTFCDGADRDIVEGQALELRRRIQGVLKRTLRRQAQEFLSRPFVDRQARLFEYPMGADERLLYEDVTRYLLQPNLAAFQGSQRRLLLIGFHRRMASSTAALASSLERVAARLRRLLDGGPREDDDVRAFVDDLEDDDLLDLGEEPVSPAAGAPPTPDSLRAELARVEDFIARANAFREDGKSRALLKAARLVLDRGRGGAGSGKMVVFTESVVTQNYLRELLLGSGLVKDDEVTLFRGVNSTPRARQALDRWKAEVGAGEPPHRQAAHDVAVRQALVHEFQTRSKVFISTEAGAKGLNLQFCETVVNYDLPWNPQRIEQRIGRCHRYGQTRDVTVINFLARDNEADRLLFSILSEKLDLFGTVLDASDVVLHRPSEPTGELLSGAVGAELETSLGRIWQRARTIGEVEAELRQLRDSVAAARQRFEDERNRTARLIESSFDEEVRRVFLERQAELPAALAELDADLERLVVAHLEALSAPFERIDGSDGKLLRIGPCASLPEGLREGMTVAIGASAAHESLHLQHPLVTAAVEEARRPLASRPSIAATLSGEAPAELVARRGQRGRLALLRVRYEGLEPVERLLPLALFEGDDEALPYPLAESILRFSLQDAVEPLGVSVPDDLFEDVVEEALFVERAELTRLETAGFERGLEQVERYVDDRLLLLRREKSTVGQRAEEARARRDGALSLQGREEAEALLVRLEAEAEALEAKIESLERREDETYRRCRKNLLDRRYALGKVERLFDVELVLE